MSNQFSRTETLIGKQAIEKLNNAKVAIFGIGGVGSYVVEGLARAGICNFILVDKDTVDITNINRQIIATTKTVGLSKVEVAKNRILEINPEAKVETHQQFFLPDSSDLFDDSVNYIVDCVDTVTAKIELVLRAKNLNIPIISCMGTGNKLNPTMFEVTDIYSTSVCPLAKVMRKELKTRGISSLKVVYSKEKPLTPGVLHNRPSQDCDTALNEKCHANNENVEKKQVPGSISFVPSVAGLIIAGEVIKDLIKA